MLTLINKNAEQTERTLDDMSFRNGFVRRCGNDLSAAMDGLQSAADSVIKSAKPDCTDKEIEDLKRSIIADFKRYIDKM